MTASRTRALFTTNSILGRFGVGGPGAHVVRALSTEFDEVVAMSRGLADGCDLPARTRVLRRPWWRRTLAGTRLHWMQLRSQADERREFDRLAALRVQRCDLAVVENSTGLRTLRRARGFSSRVILKYNNHPFAMMSAAVEAERKQWGGPGFFVDDALIDQTRQECGEADIVFAMSQSVVDALIAEGVDSKKVRLAQYGIDCTRFSPKPPPPEPFTVSFVGWLDLRKGYPYLVSGFRDAGIVGSRLLLHGGSNDRFHHDLVARLMGKADVEITRGPVEATYATSHVTVLPSVSDAFGNVVPESMACGVPVIVTDACGAAEWIKDGVDGFVIPARDAGAIEDRLRRLHGDPDLRRAMGIAARATAEKHKWSQFEDDVRSIVQDARVG